MRIFIVGLLIFTAVVAYAQPGGGGPCGGCDPDAPLTGLEYLLAAGGVYGAKKWFDKNKKGK